eukprot:SAG22_NODE_1631_length_3936_cov_2.342716_1_plen_222_part_00
MTAIQNSLLTTDGGEDGLAPEPPPPRCAAAAAAWAARPLARCAAHALAVCGLLAFVGLAFYLSGGGRSPGRGIHGSKARRAGMDRLLTETAFLMTHDSATGYLKPGGTQWNRWMQTQETTLVGQLNCGARAIDLRPTWQHNRTLFMHHDFLVPNETLADAVGSVLRWAAERQQAGRERELVLLYVSHCDEDDVERAPGGSHRQRGPAACSHTFDLLETHGA